MNEESTHRDGVKVVAVCFLTMSLLLVLLAVTAAIWTADQDAWKVWLALAAQYGVPAAIVVWLRRSR